MQSSPKSHSKKLKQPDITPTLSLLIHKIFLLNLALKQIVGPDLICKYKRKNEDHHHQHNLKGQRAGRGIVGRKAVIRIDAGWKQVWKQPDYAEKDCPDNGQGGSEPGFEPVLLIQK